MARVTNDGQKRASTTSPLMSQTSHLRDIRQTGCDVMSVLISQEADMLLANLAYGHDNCKLQFIHNFSPSKAGSKFASHRLNRYHVPHLRNTTAISNIQMVCFRVR